MKSKFISVVNAQYIGDYKVEIFFNDTTSKVVDFGVFFLKKNHPQFNKYKTISNFKKFKIDQGNIVWGENWDLIFPIYDLYKGKI
jgi:hypothetical protein